MQNENYGEVAREIPEFRVKYKDVFHLKNLYIMMHEYLAEEGWTSDDPLQSAPGMYHSGIETLYREAHFQKGLHQGGKEMWIFWRMFKHYRRRYSRYFRNHLEIDFHMVYVQNMEVIHQGKKMKIQKGEIEIFFRPKVMMETGFSLKKHWFLRFFYDLFYGRIMSQELDKREKELYRVAYQFQNIVKKYFNMRTFVPIPEPFHPTKYGYGFPDNPELSK